MAFFYGSVKDNVGHISLNSNGRRLKGMGAYDAYDLCVKGLLLSIDMGREEALKQILPKLVALKQRTEEAMKKGVYPPGFSQAGKTLLGSFYTIGTPTCCPASVVMPSRVIESNLPELFLFSTKAYLEVIGRVGLYSTTHNSDSAGDCPRIHSGGLGVKTCGYAINKFQRDPGDIRGAAITRELANLLCVKGGVHVVL